MESIGYLSELKKTYDDPIAHFTDYAKKLTEKAKKEKNKTISIDTTETLESGTNDSRNVGYGVLKELYRSLNLDRFWNWKTRGKRSRFSVDQIFRLLTFSRALNPGSKRFTLKSKDFFFEPFDGFSLDDIYNALDIIADNQEALQKWIYENSRKIFERDTSVSYFDCTNYYFDIGRPDVDDLNINHFKETFTDSRIIFVADRGLNTSDNIYWINGDNKKEHNPRDGYVYGQSIRGADEEFKIKKAG